MERSVIVCTRNRGNRIAATLESIRGLNSAVPTELIVVDNGSTDSTRSVVEDFISTGSPSEQVAYLFEPRPGLSRARNAGAKAASGEVLLFTDDDVTVPPNWADALSAPIESDRAIATVGEIDIAPHLLREWMTDEDRGVLVSTISIGNPAMPNLIGASMAMRRDVLIRFGGFNEDLGVGGRIAGGEDLFLTRMLLDQGEVIAFVAGAAVTHSFDPARLRIRDRLSRIRGDANYQAWWKYHHDNQLTGFARTKSIALTPADWMIRRFAPLREGSPHPFLKRVVYAKHFNSRAAHEQRNP